MSSPTPEPQPIETAPKDGTDVLLWCPRIYGKGKWVIGSWTDDKHTQKPGPFWRLVLVGSTRIMDSRQNPPTHWLPLPEPLSTLTKGDQP